MTDKHLGAKFDKITRQSMERAAQVLMERAELIIEAYAQDNEFEKDRAAEIAAELRQAAGEVRRIAESPLT